MKIATTIARVLMGLLFLMSAIAYWFRLVDGTPEVEALRTFMEGMEASVYFLPLLKVVELLCGLAFVINRYVRLAAVLIAPVIVNIFLVHAFIAPQGLPIAIFLVVANALVAYQHRDAYRPLFEA